MTRITQHHCKTFHKSVYEKLKDNNFLNCIDFVSHDPEEIVRKTGISFKDIVALRGILLAELSAFPQDGDSLLLDARETVGILPTGCQCLDDLLNGGVYTSEITEICGPASSGKSQICLSLALAVGVQTEQHVVYIDSGGTFDAQRLQHVLQHSSLTQQEAEAACRRIQCRHAFDAYELVSVLEELRHQLYTQTDVFYSSVKLVVIDCITALLSPLLGAGQSEGYGVMTQISRILKPLAAEFSVAIVLTNNVVEWDGEIKPSLGRSWASVPNTRVQLYTTSVLEGLSRERGLGDEIHTTRRSIKAVLSKSTKQSIGGSVDITITDGGIAAAQS